MLRDSAGRQSLTVLSLLPEANVSSSTLASAHTRSVWPSMRDIQQPSVGSRMRTSLSRPAQLTTPPTSTTSVYTAALDDAVGESAATAVSVAARERATLRRAPATDARECELFSSPSRSGGMTGCGRDGPDDDNGLGDMRDRPGELERGEARGLTEGVLREFTPIKPSPRERGAVIRSSASSRGSRSPCKFAICSCSRCTSVAFSRPGDAPRPSTPPP
mmetsp:Transcript_16290/g.36474  ORF Transcript_16290/g.36474 Transcript_16290/m.36474 type:complete len:218 (-) Transcript_16290:1541-2194(-)